MTLLLRDLPVPSPTSLTLNLHRRSGYLADVCERWVPHAEIRRYLFHVGDVLGVHPVRREVLMVQATSIGNLSTRVKKVRGQAELPALLRAGISIQCWGWYRTPAGRWGVKVVAVRPGDFEEALLQQPARRRRRGTQRELFD